MRTYMTHTHKHIHTIDDTNTPQTHIQTHTQTHTCTHTHTHTHTPTSVSAKTQRTCVAAMTRTHCVRDSVFSCVDFEEVCKNTLEECHNRERDNRDERWVYLCCYCCCCCVCVCVCVCVGVVCVCLCVGTHSINI